MRPLSVASPVRMRNVRGMRESAEQVETAYCPELNPAENLWQFLHQNRLGNRVFQSYGAVVDACCDAWKALTTPPGTMVRLQSRCGIDLPGNPCAEAYA